MQTTITSLVAQSIVDDRIRYASAQRAARDAARRSAKPRLKLRLHLRRATPAVPSV